VIPDVKICPICNEEKDKSLFSIRSKPSGYKWLRRECKKCEQAAKRKRYAENEYLRARNLERGKKYVEKNRERYLEYHRNRRVKDPEGEKLRYKLKYEKKKEEIKKSRREYYRKNPEKHKAVVKEYEKNNLTAVRARQRNRHSIRIKSDAEYKIVKRLRCRLNSALKASGARKTKGTEDLLGCSIVFFKSYTESKFLYGMNWGNYTFFGWHIDHIKPCASFDLTNEDEQKKCFHYTNLQPLWWRDNLTKGAKIA
jgi:hypothetical protein